MGVRKTTPNKVLWQESPLGPLAHAWLLRTVKFWNSLVALPADSFYRRVAAASAAAPEAPRSHHWAGSLARALKGVGYPVALPLPFASVCERELKGCLRASFMCRRF